MPSFAYKGRDTSGKSVTGKIEAINSAVAADMLRERAVIPTSIVNVGEAGGAGDKPPLLSIALFKEPIKHVDILLFSRQMHTLLKAGVPLMRTLTGLQESGTNETMKELLQDLRESLDSGRELSVAMARHPKVFTLFYLSMVRVGEMTGRLEDIFLRLFEHMEFERFMSEQVKSALRYPTFVVAAMVIAMFLVNLFVIPTFAKVFEGFNTELPFLTRLLLGVSAFTMAWWHVMLGGLMAAIFGFRSFISTEKGLLWWDRLKLNFPIAGKIIRKATLARFARSFALASRSGVPIMQVLNTVAQTVDNAYIAGKVTGMREGVERGESILRTASNSKVFTPMVVQMIAIGEESGALDDMMEEIAEMYQNEVEYELKSLAQQIEPILIVALGVMVLILALGIFLPIWELGKVAVKH